jgi:hypothetical protein
MSIDLTGDLALVTGAGRRIGRALALALAEAGCDVVVHYRSSDTAAEETARAVRGRGREAWTVRADLEADGGPDAAFDAARDAAGRAVGILVNNASIFPPGRLPETDPDDVLRNVRVNAMAPMVLARRLAGQAACGQVLNLLDTRIADYDAAHAAYHLSKRMLFTLTRMMALEFAPGLRVNAVAPGLILPPPGEDEAYLERMKQTNPLGRTGSPEEVAEAALYLLRAPFVTGQVLFVDGGRHMKGAVYG